MLSGCEASLAVYGRVLNYDYRHYVVNIHPGAIPAARRYEVLHDINPSAAALFRRAIFTNRTRLREEGDSFLDELVAQFGYDPQLIAQESEASAIKERLEAQRAEFAAYEFKGTPAYIAAGIPMQGPLPFRELENIICNELRRTSFTAAASPSAVDNSDCWALVKPDWKRLYELDNDRPLPAETP